MDEQRYREVLAQLEYQAGQAEVWRDAVSNWFLRASGIPDAKGRVGNYPGRMEAESANSKVTRLSTSRHGKQHREGKRSNARRRGVRPPLHTVALPEYFRFECGISIRTPAHLIFVRSSGAGCWMNGLRTIACLRAKSTARHPLCIRLKEPHCGQVTKSASKGRRTAVRLRRSIT